MKHRAHSHCVLVVLALHLGPARAADPAPPAATPAPDSAAATEFILGNTVFVLAHEFGHAIIRDF